MSDTVVTAALVAALGLRPHPEGGFYREVHRSAETLALDRGERAACTAIYYLLPAGAFSALHRVRSSDEIWAFFDGAPLELWTLVPGGAPRLEVLGRDFAAGERPIAVVPAGVWQAAVPRGDRHSLCACVVAPGFDFADFEMPARCDLLLRHPEHADFIRRFTR